MSNKRYYWLKLDENFFEDDTIQYLEEQENGKDYVIFYLKLSLRSLKDDGKLIRYVGSKLIPYDVKALSKLTNTPVDTVAVAMKTFIDIGLIERLDSGEIYLSQINEMVGSETDVAKRVRKHRAKLEIDASDLKNDGLLQRNIEVTKSNTEKEIEKELEIDIEKELEIDIEKPSKAYALDSEFEQWWKLYGKKIDKKKARQKFKLCRKQHSIEQIMVGTREYLKTITDKKYQKHPTTFLNGENYLDVDGYKELQKDNGRDDRLWSPEEEEEVARRLGF